MFARLHCQLVRVEGRVQGVGFRESCVDRAVALDLQGWVRNRFDGSVEVLVQGPPEAVDQMVDWLHQGPPGAHVTRLQRSDAPVEELPARFERRPSA